MSILSAAEAWGVPPWIVIGKESTPKERLVWLMRQIAYRNVRAEKEAADLAAYTQG